MAKPATASSATPSIIAAGVRIKGELVSTSEIQLDGGMEGDIRCTALIIGSTGEVTGTISAQSVIVLGAVEGQIRARSVRLEKSARVTGDIWHENIGIEAGAMIDGRLVHTDSPVSEKPAVQPAPLTLSHAAADTTKPLPKLADA